MENTALLVSVPLELFCRGIEAIEQIEILKKYVGSRYGATNLDIQNILGLDPDDFGEAD